MRDYLNVVGRARGMRDYLNVVGRAGGMRDYLNVVGRAEENERISVSYALVFLNHG